MTDQNETLAGKSRPILTEGLLTGGAPRMWERVVLESLPAMRAALPPGSRVLEIGYGDGLLSCWLAAELGWKVVGFDVSPEAQENALKAASRFGLEQSLDFRLCRPEETRTHAATYDAVFVKTVFYSSRSVAEYAEWLDWVLTVLRPGGFLVNYETGRASGLMQLYRRLRGRVYTDLCLYTREVEELHDARFEVVFRRHYGGLSQFLAPLPGIYTAAARLEEALSRRTADNCFVVSYLGRKRG